MGTGISFHVTASSHERLLGVVSDWPWVCPVSVDINEAFA